MCLGAIYWARPDRVFYANTKADAAAIGFDDQFIYDEIEKPLPQRRLPMQQFLRDEALVAFQAWEAKEGRADYQTADLTDFAATPATRAAYAGKLKMTTWMKLS